ncbi:hypothetical protein C7423_1172 [Pantoea ananatis]|nr:hypothetical protein C7426_1274 [Pantoea ananatis]REC88914.1 hypothetical protein C7423_1172 [Pantoea ananatis]
MKTITFTGIQIIAIFIHTDDALKLGHQLPHVARSGQSD